MNQRFQVLDVLRGFALFGILLINISTFAGAAGPPGFGAFPSISDWIGSNILLFFVESKFFTLFSFLFGLGFAIQLQRADVAGLNFGWRYFADICYHWGHLILDEEFAGPRDFALGRRIVNHTKFDISCCS